jgi:hypothetical protein
MTHRDAEAFEHYEDPAHREPASGPARRRRERTLTQHVPVRFPTETVDAVRELAEADGLSVSAWIRRTVDRELAERSTRAEASPQRILELVQRDIAALRTALERTGSG